MYRIASESTRDLDRRRYTTVNIGGLHTIVATKDELASLMVEDCVMATPETSPKLVFSSNGQGVSYSGRNPQFAAAMRKADIIHADGMPVVFASRLLTKTPLPERVGTTDFFHNAAQAASDAGLSFYMLGGTEAENQRAVNVIKKTYPKLCIAGRRNGYFPRSEDENVCAEIRESGCDVLWVAFGKPLQEFWSVENKDRLRGVGWLKTCGGLYGHLCGNETRAPQWVQNIGFEWFYRAIQEPRRLGLRYLATNPHALYRLIIHTRNID